MSLEEQLKEAREIIQWFIDNDETNEGDEPLLDKDGQSWNDINAFWIEGLNRARKFMFNHYDIKESSTEQDEVGAE